MGQFAQQFKDYTQYHDGDCYRKSVPANLSDALAEVMVSSCGPESEPSTAATMRKATDDLLTMAGKKPTANWTPRRSKRRFDPRSRSLEEARFDKFMDATLNAFHRLCRARPATPATTRR